MALSWHLADLLNRAVFHVEGRDEEFDLGTLAKALFVGRRYEKYGDCKSVECNSGVHNQSLIAEVLGAAFVRSLAIDLVAGIQSRRNLHEDNCYLK